MWNLFSPICFVVCYRFSSDKLRLIAISSANHPYFRLTIESYMNVYLETHATWRTRRVLKRNGCLDLFVFFLPHKIWIRRIYWCCLSLCRWIIWNESNFEYVLTTMRIRWADSRTKNAEYTKHKNKEIEIEIKRQSKSAHNNIKCLNSTQLSVPRSFFSLLFFSSLQIVLCSFCRRSFRYWNGLLVVGERKSKQK